MWFGSSFRAGTNEMTQADTCAADAAALSSPTPERRPRVLLALSGSVACLKAPELALALSAFCEVRCVATSAALHFLACPEAVAADPARQPGRLLAGCQLFTDADEWRAWEGRGDPVLHLSLRRWADLLIVAPLSANSLAKLSGGHAESLVSCVARAWDWRKRKPLLAAPAMNTEMWESPLTGQQLRVLRELGVVVVHPMEKRLVCGDVGMGAMATVEVLVEAVRHALRAYTADEAAEAEAAVADEELQAVWESGADVARAAGKHVK